MGDSRRGGRLAAPARSLRTGRGAAGLRTAGTVKEFLSGTAHSIAAAGASAILVMGFPVLPRPPRTTRCHWRRGDLGGDTTRAPLLVPLTAMQGNLIAHFVDHRAARLRALAAPAGVVLVVGLVGVAAAGLLGPWLLRVAFGEEYQAGGPLLAWLTAGAVSIVLLTVTGAATVAAALHRPLPLGWVGATVAAALLLTMPLDLQTRTVVALLWARSSASPST